jgi:hypothetical protein
VEQPNSYTESCDLIAEIIADGSQPITPRPAAPILSDVEQAFADAIKRYQCDHRRALLTWREIFEIVQALGYRKVAPPASAPLSQANGDQQKTAPVDGPKTETPS